MKRYILYLLTLALAAGGCTKNFDELRKNPNNVDDATPGSFLAPILYNTIVTDLTRAHRMGRLKDDDRRAREADQDGDKTGYNGRDGKVAQK